MGKLEKDMAVGGKKQKAVNELKRSRTAKEGKEYVPKYPVTRSMVGIKVRGKPDLKKAKAHADEAYDAAKEAQRLKKKEAKAFKDGYYHE